MRHGDRRIPLLREGGMRRAPMVQRRRRPADRARRLADIARADQRLQERLFSSVWAWSGGAAHVPCLFGDFLHCKREIASRGALR